jgi:RNAse (barnase) inhibitor barstar
MTTTTSLSEIHGTPVFKVLTADASATTEAVWAWGAGGLVVRVLRGQKMRSAGGLMDEVGAALQLPDYFGENWSALDDCLSDLQWLLPAAGIALVLMRADEVLVDEPGDGLAAFVSVLRSASSTYAQPIALGDWWDRPAVPFHVVLQAVEGQTRDVTTRWESAGAATARLSL